MRTILISVLLLQSAAFLVCRLLKKKESRICLIYQVGLVIIAFASLLTELLALDHDIQIPGKRPLGRRKTGIANAANTD